MYDPTEPQSRPSTPDNSPWWVVNALLRRVRVLILIPVLLTMLVVGLSLAKTRSYRASVSFVPQGSQELSQATGVAAQFGIQLPTQNPGQSPEFFRDLARSRGILMRAMGKDYLRVLQGDTVTGNFAQVLHLPNDIGAGSEAIELFRVKLSSGTTRETGLVTIAFEDESSEFAIQVVSTILDEVNSHYISSRSASAAAEKSFVEERLREEQNLLYEAEARLLPFLRENRQFQGSPELVIEHDRLLRDVTMRQAMVTSLQQSADQARISELRDTPILTIVDPIEVEPQARGTVNRATMALLLGAALSFMVTVLLEYLERSRSGAGSEAFQETLTLVRSLKTRLRTFIPFARAKKNSDRVSQP